MGTSSKLRIFAFSSIAFYGMSVSERGGCPPILPLAALLILSEEKETPLRVAGAMVFSRWRARLSDLPVLPLESPRRRLLRLCHLWRQRSHLTAVRACGSQMRERFPGRNRRVCRVLANQHASILRLLEGCCFSSWCSSFFEI